MIRVKSALPDNRVALWDRNPAHPGGEVLIWGDDVREVAETEAVRNAIKDGRLVEIKAETKKGRR